MLTELLITHSLTRGDATGHAVMVLLLLPAFHLQLASLTLNTATFTLDSQKYSYIQPKLKTPLLHQ